MPPSPDGAGPGRPWRLDRPNRAPPARPTEEAEARLRYERAQAESAWRRSESAAHPDDARQWLERAFAFTPSDQNLAFALATARMAARDSESALALFTRIAERHPTREVLAGIAAASLSLGRRDAARQAVERALAGAALNPALIALGRASSGPDWQPPEPDPSALIRTEGFVELQDGCITGWAWLPADPDRDPVLRIIGAGQDRTIAASDLSIESHVNVPLARPRGFRTGMPSGGPVRVIGPDGRDLWGSPLPDEAPPHPAPAPRPGAPPAVIVPVYRGREDTLACIRAVLAATGPEVRLIVVNDASPDAALVADLRQAAQAHARLTLIASCPDDEARNLGFPAAVNAGIREAAGADIVLLNSDTLVFPGWLTLLRDAAHSAGDIGTATPLSNDATIFTCPDPADPSPMPDRAEGARLAAQARRANAGLLVDVPTGHGFCLFIRADCLHETGLFDAGRFAQGYGEENDFCERARALGWRHVAVPSVYVAHRGGVSFGAAKAHLLRRNAAILDRLHPEYHARVQDFIARDPLAPARKRLDRQRFTAAEQTCSVLLVTHGGGGGTARVVRERSAAIHAEQLRPVILSGARGVTRVSDGRTDTPALRFAVPAERAALLRLLRAARPVRAELHHLLGHGAEIGTVIAALAIPFDIWIHDWQWLCARLSLLTGEWRFCGEAPVETCALCVARWGDAQETPLAPAALRARAGALMGAAERVIAPSQDAARRLRRHFPQARIEVRGWQTDPPHRAARLLPGPAPLVVAVVGAISEEKGYGLLVDCARDAKARALPLHFAVVGYTVDDTPLLESGHAFVTGPFQAGQAPALLARTGARAGFLPSIWPETWCYALSDLWDAGLDAAVFDIGTPAERVRRTGRGWVLPLGLPPARVNDALLNLQGLAGSPSANRPAGDAGVSGAR